METKDYWIYENKIIFKHYFNDKLDNYIDIISKYNELIFSNYDDCNIIIKTNNKWCIEYKENYKSSKFNQQVIIPENVTHLTFGLNFNQQIIIPQNVTHLTFGLNFNQQIIIPQNVTHLTFGTWFNQQVIIPQNVTHLIFGHIFGHNFNQQIIIPQNVTHLTFGHHFNQRVNLPNIKYLQIDCNNIDIIENLPNSIEEIIFGSRFNLELQNLPNSIKKISFDYYGDYDKKLNCLPEFVEYLELNRDYNNKIKKFPLNLKIIKCSKNYKYIDDFKDYNIIKY